MKVKNFVKVVKELKEFRSLSDEVIISAMKEALTKAFLKECYSEEASVRVEVDKTGVIHMMQQKTVVSADDIYDDEIQIELEEAQRINENFKIGDIYEEEVDITTLGRAAVLQAKGVLKQKIREAEKQMVYDAYQDKLQDMITGKIERVEPNYLLINIDKAMACMPKAHQIPNEVYREGEMINCVITQVNSQGKGAQVIVSRSDATLVKRLFERDVPEIHKGIIEIKAIAREAGERTKMAVVSHSENIDPVGSCIGPRGARVSMISEELGGEKIDIFKWNDDISELIKNALSPAAVLAVIDSTERKDGLIVVVNDDQLSLAIGKKGKNARLAVKLTGCKIDIKSVSDMEAMGIDWKRIAKERQERYEEEKRIQKELAQQQKYEESRNEGMATIDEIGVDYISEADIIEVDYVEEMKAKEAEEVQTVVEETVTEETPQATTVEETIVEETPAVEVHEETELERAARIAKEMRTDGRLGAKDGYVSKFEDIAGNNTNQLDTPVRSRKRFDDKEERRRPTYDLSNKAYGMKPIYTEEELAEIEQEEYEEEENSWINEDIDFDEYDEYYE